MLNYSNDLKNRGRLPSVFFLYNGQKVLTVNSSSKSNGLEHVLSEVSFTLNTGDWLGLVRPNGCGKSTLLRIPAGFENPDSGSFHREFCYRDVGAEGWDTHGNPTSNLPLAAGLFPILTIKAVIGIQQGWMNLRIHMVTASSPQAVSQFDRIRAHSLAGKVFTDAGHVTYEDR